MVNVTMDHLAGEVAGQVEGLRYGQHHLAGEETAQVESQEYGW